MFKENFLFKNFISKKLLVLFLLTSLLFNESKIFNNQDLFLNLSNDISFEIEKESFHDAEFILSSQSLFGFIDFKILNVFKTNISSIKPIISYSQARSPPHLS